MLCIWHDAPSLGVRNKTIAILYDRAYHGFSTISYYFLFLLFSSIFYAAFTEVLSFQDETFINFQFGDTEQIYSDTPLWGKSAVSKRWAVDAAAQSHPI